MKSGALLPSNLPSVIDRSNLSPSRDDTIYFYSKNDPTNILWNQVVARSENKEGGPVLLYSRSPRWNIY